MKKRRVFNRAGGVLGAKRPAAVSAEAVLVVSDGPLSWEEAAELAILLREQEEAKRRNQSEPGREGRNATG